ncbi:hypothetical protein TNCV_4063101 [Trichonephila clavipes]|nr:hypothetical protein TNCV_4063101 [Trichonephila clavipes]
MSRLKRPPAGVMWKLEEDGASSGVVIVPILRFKITTRVSITLPYHRSEVQTQDWAKLTQPFIALVG